MLKFTTLLLFSLISISTFAQSENTSFEYKIFRGGTYSIPLSEEHSFIPQYVGEHLSGLLQEKDSVFLSLAEVNIDYKTAKTNAKKSGDFTNLGTINNEKHLMTTQTWLSQQNKEMKMISYARFKENKGLIISIVLPQNSWNEYEYWFRKMVLEIVKIE